MVNLLAPDNYGTNLFTTCEYTFRTEEVTLSNLPFLFRLSNCLEM